MWKIIAAIILFNLTCYGAALFSWAEAARSCQDCCEHYGVIPLFSFYKWAEAGNTLFAIGLGSDIGLGSYLLAQVRQPRQKLNLMRLKD